MSATLLQQPAFYLAVGPKGIGKGTWSTAVAAAVSRGDHGAARTVLLIQSDDSPSIDVKPRMVAAGADTDRVQLVIEPFELPRDLDRLRNTALSFGDVGMIVIDPVANHLSSNPGSVRAALSGLSRLADDLSCPVLGVRHSGKGRDGASAWTDIPRAVLTLVPDDGDPTKLYVRTGGSERAFRIELADVGLGEPVTRCVEIGACA